MFRPSIQRTMRIVAAVVAAASLATATQCAAQSRYGSPTETLADTGDAEREICAALERTMPFNLTDTPLKDVVAALQRSTGVPIALDTKALTDAGVTEDTPITFVEPAISARMALDTMLASKDVSWIVQRDLLIITTSDVAKTKTVTRVYPVADLVFIETADAYDADFDSLIEVITSIVNPASWDANGGAGSIAPFVPSGALVISQTREGHEQVESLLRLLRKVRDQQGLRTALKIVGTGDEPANGGASAVEETNADDTPQPAPARSAVAAAPWQVPRVYH